MRLYSRHHRDTALEGEGENETYHPFIFTLSHSSDLSPTVPHSLLDPYFFSGCALKHSSICISFCSEGLWPAHTHPLVFCSARVCEVLSRWVCLCVALPSGSLRGCSTHTVMPLIALFCPSAYHICSSLSHTTCPPGCYVWVFVFVCGKVIVCFLYAICTSECVNLFLLNTQDGSQRSANQLFVPQLIFEVDELI